ncbi:hypothetical protein WUBG_06363 [Wuchereria bancrofti]|uniref:Uncharacterized protein n=1 Tax=Wuchereria bancrofti TaxID=6293 RepID=J9EJU6_WUCBA|nr:hypothetical protein WUBG_06363 [Wuchereria bancrofti]
MIRKAMKTLMVKDKWFYLCVSNASVEDYIPLCFQYNRCAANMSKNGYKDVICGNPIHRVHFQCTIHEEEVATILILSKTAENNKKKSSVNSFKMHKSILPDVYIIRPHLSGRKRRQIHMNTIEVLPKDCSNSIKL